MPRFLTLVLTSWLQGIVSLDLTSKGNHMYDLHLCKDRDEDRCSKSSCSPEDGPALRDITVRNLLPQLLEACFLIILLFVGVMIFGSALLPKEVSNQTGCCSTGQQCCGC